MADAKHPHRIAAGRNKFSSIPHICLEIRTAISPVRHRSAVAVCKSPPDPDNGGAAERNQIRQFSQVSRDLINDYAADYGVRVRCINKFAQKCHVSGPTKCVIGLCLSAPG